MSADPIHVPLPGPLTGARFVERPNRFLLRCRLPPPGDSVDRPGPETSPPGTGSAGEVVEVHLADPGRLNELL
ncbi:MAG: hypothetical protein ACOCUW_04475, partial [Gemmatimonadota bacterium]